MVAKPADYRIDVAVGPIVGMAFDRRAQGRTLLTGQSATKGRPDARPAEIRYHDGMSWKNWNPLMRRTGATSVLHPDRRPSKRALLCIDLQVLDAARGQGIFEDHAEGTEEEYFRMLEDTVLPNVQRLQSAYREQGEEIIHVRIQSHTADGRDRSPAHKRLGLHAAPGSKEAEFLESVAPEDDEIVINKTASGVFDSTNLEYILRNLGVELVEIVGVYTDECVSTTVRVAADLGFVVTLIEDACATVSPELHHYAVATLRDRYARVIDTKTAMEDLRHEPRPESDVNEPPEQSSEAESGRCVVLLGGEAFRAPGEELTMAGQFDFARRTIEKLTPLLTSGRELVVGHGNGPQVGEMLARVEASLGEAYSLPLEVCVAESEGELGYVLQQVLHNSLRENGVRRSAVDILTQTVVDADDPAFENPTKPIGPVYDEQGARELEKGGFAVREVEGGWRRVVPSPRPLDIVELSVVQVLLRMGSIVVAGGGGGVPVVRRSDGTLRGVDGVVDKDRAGSLLARRLKATDLIMVTSVPCAYRHYGTDRQEPIGQVTPEELGELLEAGHFETGTMAPKVEAAIEFAESGGRAIICDVESVADALEGHAGTRVIA
ncbi:MAG: carbamate kinase [Xanthomonadales bacterium]|nr:carbamate kinase [Xanthomonadales bacterium]